MLNKFQLRIQNAKKNMHFRHKYPILSQTKGGKTELNKSEKYKKNSLSI